MARPKIAKILGRDGQLREIQLPEKGSILRDKIAAMGFPAGSSTNDGAETAEQTMVLEEAGVLDRLIIAPRSRVALTGLKHNGEPLTTGYVPAILFGPASVANPHCGVPVDQTSKVKATLKNESGAAIVPNMAWSVSPKGSPARAPRVLAIGQSSTITAISTSSSATVTFTIERPAVLDRLVIDYGGSGVTEDDLYVTSVKYDGDELLSGAAVPVAMFSPENLNNPRLGVPVEPGHALSVRLYNQDGVNAAEAWVGFSCM